MTDSTYLSQISSSSMENTVHSYGYMNIFNASRADYMFTTIILFIGGMLYYIIIHSKLFQPIRDSIMQWKTQLLINTFIRNENTIQNTFEPNYIREIISAF
jgi:hypothetical protein